MGNVSTSMTTHAPRAIAGPRRVRATPPPLPAAVASAERDLPSLYDDEAITTRRAAVSPACAARVLGDGSDLTAPTTKIPRPSSPPARWFAIGLVAGIVAFALARGDAMGGVRAARAWGETTLRSLKKAHPPARSLPVVPASQIEAPPCSLTDEDCAVLMAPFVQAEAQTQAELASIPVVNVSDLPKWKPPVVYVAPPPKPVDMASPVAQPEAPEPAGGPYDEPSAPPPPPRRAPGPFDAPGPVGPGPSIVASAPATP